MNLTKRQGEILDFMFRFYLSNDMLPDTGALCNHFGWASRNCVTDHRAALERKGALIKNEVGKYKFTNESRLLMGVK